MHRVLEIKELEFRYEITRRAHFNLIDYLSKCIDLEFLVTINSLNINVLLYRFIFF